MSLTLAQAREKLARANRIVAQEGVLDAFGHVTMRHPTDPNRYLMSYSRAPELVQAEDIHEFSLDSKIVRPIDERLYGERVIHGEIYKARPDVNAVCHHHAPSVLPFCISGMTLKPVYHLGATLGAEVPFWDSRDEFGDTTLIVAKPEEGASLARALGPNWIVLMRRHGATVAGISLDELMFRTIYTARNAAMQIQAHILGNVSPLTEIETEMAGTFNLQPMPVARACEYWSVRLDKAEGHWRPPATKRAAAAPSRAQAKSKTKTPAKTKAASAKSRRSGTPKNGRRKP